jgi:NADH-quinone oxidoreductase subunit H
MAFRDPAALLAFVLLLGCARIAPDPMEERTGVEAFVDDASLTPRPPRGPWLAAACRAHRFIVAGLASTLFLGGWSIPGLSPSQQDGRPLLELAGAVCLFAKAGALVAVLAIVRQALPVRSPAEAVRSTALRSLPLALTALVLTAAWTRWGTEAPAHAMVSVSLVVCAVLAGGGILHRLRYGVAEPGAEGQLSTFL